MPITLYNTLTRRKEAFVPLDPERVRMYVCGPTVYDTAHIGNGRAIVVFDQLYRLLRHTYGAEHVKYVRNITDIDDRIIDAARANGEPIAALTERTAAVFHADMAALGALPPDVEPRCTGHVPQMVAMIEKLIMSQHAYEAEGHVLFSVASWLPYGKLSRRSRQEMIAGARVEVAPYKKDPGDFVLWKPSNPEQPGWDSPWGRGRPGWHIECSAMSEAHLGETFDIHGGGVDLVFPHHENELAQSEAAHQGRPFARFWVHNGFLSVESTKMSKSLGNFVTVHELLAQAEDPVKLGEIVRLALLSTHYRDPLDWTEQRIDQSKQTLDRWYRALDLPAGGESADTSDGFDPVAAALEDDLNTPLTISRIHGMATEIFASAEGQERAVLQATLKRSGQLLGVFRFSADYWLHGINTATLNATVGEFTLAATATVGETPEVRERIAARAAARKERRFAEADRIRAELLAKGIVLEDRPDGTTSSRRA